MKKITLFFLLSVAPLGFIQAQSNPDKCGIEEDLSDAKKFEKALKCKNDIKGEHPLYPVKTDSSVVYVVTLSNSVCKNFKNEDGLWVTLLPELQSVYQTKSHREFDQVENRLKQLIGLKEGDTYQCLTVLKTTYDSLKKPEKGTSGYPYTGRGFTCDWYYGDGCRYGLSEFILKKKAENFVSYEINNCSIMSKEINGCWIENILGERCPVQ